MFRNSKKALAVFFGLMFLLTTENIYAKGMELNKLERMIVIPSADRLVSGKTLFDLDYLPAGSILISAKTALSPKFTVGISYGASHLIDNTKAVLNKTPGAYCKYALCEDDYSSLQMFLGIDTQGWGEQSKNPATGKKRYFIKAPGIFFVVGKQFNLKCIKDIGICGGLNYNFFENEDDGDLNFYAGAEKKLLEYITLVAEYDFAWNDNHFKAYGENKGYLNGSLRIQIRQEFFLEIILLDAFSNNKNTTIQTKAIRITFQPEYWF
jgi:hypothetical protein